VPPHVITGPSVQPLADLHDIGQAIQRMDSVTKFEWLSALPDHARYDERLMRTSWEMDIGMLDRGVDLRVIYPARAARVPQIMDYLAQFAARGAQVRVIGSIPNRLVISDRVRAIIPEKPDQASGQALLVTGTVLVRALYKEFSSMWRASYSVGVAGRASLSEEIVPSTLSVLASGITDGVAAKLLGVSERTVRRRVAAVMELLGATSRFDAGAKAAKSGWI
jgi:hypothetical protein